MHLGTPNSACHLHDGLDAPSFLTFEPLLVRIMVGMWLGAPRVLMVGSLQQKPLRGEPVKASCNLLRTTEGSSQCYPKAAD